MTRHPTARRISAPTLALALAFGGVAFVLVGCDRTPDAAAPDQADPSSSQNAAGFFQPQAGESWTYRVQKELPLDVELAEDDLARRPEQTDSAHLITYERVRTCTGTREIADIAEPLTVMEVSESGTPLGHELYDVSTKGVYFRGWVPTGDEEVGNLLDSRIKLATPRMQAGQQWTSPGADPARQFRFRVIERCEITVPAGTFDTARIEITSEHEGQGLKRTIWFAEKAGIAREESVYYGPARTLVRERAELVHLSSPADGPPADNAPVSVPPQPTPPPGNDDPTADPAPPQAAADHAEADGDPATAAKEKDDSASPAP